ncbi:MAG: AI-2E family transporter [Rubrobacteraceae bacterium]|nr:AI-2E family transporter [Rubrobacteraceae bacterium]
MDGSSNDPPVEGLAEAVDAAPSRSSFLRVLLVLAATVVVLVGMRLAAPVLNPIIFAVVLSLLFGPIYTWLGRRGVPTPLALVMMLFGMTLLFLVIFYVLGASIARFSAGIGSYSAELNGRLASIQDLVDRLGLTKVHLRDVVEPRALTGVVGVVLSGIAGFLSNLFLILMIVLFLLAEGPALMDRLRTSAGRNHPQVERLAFVGQGVVRQFGLRAILNLVTAVGVTVLLFVLGVDFALMWGILTFFLSFVPYIGLVLAVLLALAEFGVGRALIVIAGVTIVNILAENVLSPMMMSRGLSISPTVVFLSFVFWAWLLGGPGAFLALPITLFVAVMLETFPETRWLANLMGISSPNAEAGPSR